MDAGARGAARIARAQETMALTEMTWPLRRPILLVLADGSATTNEIVQKLPGADEIDVRHEILNLHTQRLIGRAPGNDPLRFQLTQEGEIQLSKHRAFGAPAPPPTPPTREQILEFLEAAYTAAVGMLNRGEAEDAGVRLGLIAEQARKHDAPELAAKAQVALERTGVEGGHDLQ